MSASLLPPRVTREKAIAALAAAFPSGETSKATFLATQSDDYLAARLGCLLEGLGMNAKPGSTVRFDSAVPTASQQRALDVLRAPDLQGGVQ